MEKQMITDIERERWGIVRHRWDMLNIIGSIVMVGIILFVAYLALFRFAGTSEGAAIDEVNLQRKNFGLPPFREDPKLTAHAQKRAEYLARHHISLYNGNNGHEGFFLPVGERYITEGCGAMPRGTPQDCWATCAMRCLGDYKVGAGVAWGDDGVRYMCLIVRAHGTRDGGLRKPLIKTSHLTPDAPRIKRLR